MSTTQNPTVGTTIHRQINFGVMMALGAHDLRSLSATKDHLGGLAFKARILPFTKSGHRGTAARVMDVTITLNGMDYYDIRVTYAPVGHRFDRVEHANIKDVDVFALNHVLLALDYDGDTILNPRYAADFQEN